jgi:2'-5' RNA ligase
VKPGIIVMAELHGPIAERVLEVQRRFDPRMAGELPPHITITGSSGMGPISPSVSDDAVRAAIAAAAAATPPITAVLEPAMQFMQSNVVVLPINPNGAIRALHERIKSSGLPAEAARFTFTPHLTLSFYPELTRDRLRELRRFRIDEPIVIDSIQAYRAVDVFKTLKLADCSLTATV